MVMIDLQPDSLIHDRYHLKHLPARGGFGQRGGYTKQPPIKRAKGGGGRENVNIKLTI